ncbi:MAG: putative membrane protein [Flavobacteriales bacterium]|jgi:putative membrane protein
MPDNPTVQKWQRCSPISIVYFLLRTLKSLVNLWPAMAGVVFVEDFRALIFSHGLPVLFILVTVTSILNYWFFTFQYDEKGVRLKTGFFHKKRLSLQFDRVQEINLNQAIYYRPFSLWSASLDTAGSKDKEIVLPAINQICAEELKALHLSHKRDVTETEKEKVQAEDTRSDYYLKIDIANLIRYGLMNNSMIYLMIIVSPILGQSQAFSEVLIQKIKSISFLSHAIELSAAYGVWATLSLFTVVFILSIIFLYILSIALAIIRYWNYTLDISDDHVQFHAGLLNRIRRGFKSHKLQSIEVKQGLIARLLQRYTIKITQANDSRPGTQGTSSAFIIPVCDRQQRDELLTIFKVESGDWQRVKMQKALWTILLWATPLSIAVVIASYFLPMISRYYVIIPILFVAITNYLYWKKRGYYFGKNWSAFRSGLLSTKIVYVPHVKLQKIQINRGPILDFHNAASIQVWNGSGIQSLSFVDYNALNTERNKLLDHVGRHQGKWM